MRKFNFFVLNSFVLRYLISCIVTGDCVLST